MNYAALVYVADAAAGGTGYGDVIAFLSALAGLASVAIVSLRKRKDVAVEEMQQRISGLEARNEDLEDDLATAQAVALANGRDLFLVRQVLATNGWPDPTKDPSEVEDQ